MVRILVADDHDVVRSGVRTILDKHEGWEGVGEARMARNPSTGCLSPLNLNPKKDEAVSPDVPGSLKLDDTEFSIRMAGAGVGLFCCLRDRVGRELSAGELETVLDRWIMPNPGFHAYDASHRQVHSTLRAVLDHLES